jgi:cation transport protein ChaC
MMNTEFDPFSYHPELREKITDPLSSSFRTFTTAKLATLMRQRGLPVDWWYTESEREEMRAQSLAGHLDSDLWVFGYGSLMWNPAFRFEEVHRAHMPNYARRFILKDIYGGRGTRDAPGLMAALDKGAGCEGLVFKIARENVEEETEVLWRREQVAPAYIPLFAEAVTSHQHFTALTFVANHGVELIDANLTREEQIHYFATGTGFMGSSLEYLINIDSHFTALGIVDEEVSALLRETRSYIDSR